MSFTINTGEVLKNLKKFDDKFRAALVLDAKNVAIQMENWAKQNASWSDRTTNARRYLQSHVQWTHVNELMVAMSHHVEYGVYLELANERKYAIIEEAIRQYTNEFKDGWKQIINGSKL